MKKLSMKFLMMTGLMVAIFFSCNNDDDDTASPAAPTFSSPPADVSVEIGEAEDVTYSVNTPGRYTTATVASSDDAVATATVKTQAAANSTSGSVVVTVTGVAAGSATITLTVNDGEGQRATDELGVTVEEEDTETPDGPANAADSLGNIEDLSTLAAAIEATGLDDDLNGDGPFTIFAPNNTAFAKLLTSLEVEDLDGLIETLTAEGVAGVLQAHVVEGSLGATEVTAAAGGEALETLNEDATITVTQVGDSLFVNGAGILRADIEVGNGVIHVIDSVINNDIDTDTEEPGEEITVAASTEGVGTTTWTSNNSYLLDGFVFVNDGQTLTIEPGTVIRGLPGQGGGASALIVARGGTIIAEGTAEDPIIFTGSTDDLDGTIPEGEAGLWGGVIILGRATTNNLDTQGENNVEGIPTNEARAVYGGTDDADNSGTLSYVSIRHGGSLLDAENEINGLTLGAVGSGTTINNIEVWSNLDDGIEFFGGTVNASNLVVGYPGDDGLDADEGYRGNIQRAIVWQAGGELDSDDPRGLELDGGVDANETAEPYSTPVLTNLTVVYDDTETGGLTDAFIIRDNSGASIYNSIFVGADAPFNFEDTDQAQSSFDRYEADQLVISGNIFFNVNGENEEDNDFAELFTLSNVTNANAESDIEAELAANNTVVDPEFGEGEQRFTPSSEAVSADLATLPAGLDTYNYKGAVDPSADEPYFANWTKAWEVISGESGEGEGDGDNG